VLAFVPAIGIMASKLLRIPIRIRSLAIWGSVTVFVIGVFAAIDLSRPADSRTHLGRLVESVGDDGWGSFVTVVTRKLSANLGVITSTVWTAMVPLALILAVYLLWRAPGAARAIRGAIPESLAGLLVVGVLGFALNDSGIAVPGVLLGVVNAALVYLMVKGLPSAAPEAVPASVPSDATEVEG
jgi:NAD/NADP transhydrogenase beta subunit